MTKHASTTRRAFLMTSAAAAASMNWEAGKFKTEDLVRLYKGEPAEGHKNNFYRCVRDGGLPISGVFSHVQAMNACHLCANAARFNRVIK